MNQIFTPFFSIMTEGSRQREIDYSSETIFFFILLMLLQLAYLHYFFFPTVPPVGTVIYF